MQSFSTVMGYPLALAAASTLFMALAMLVLLALEIKRNPRAAKPAAHTDAAIE
jgi:TRAP-type transport system small permease protein